MLHWVDSRVLRTCLILLAIPLGSWNDIRLVAVAVLGLCHSSFANGQTLPGRVPGHTGIPANEEADRQANLEREGRRAGTVRERIYTSAANRARRIWEARTAAKAKWEADKCSKHHGYRLKGKAGSKRPIPMNSVKPLAARFYQRKSGQAPVGTYLKQFGHRDDDKGWWCGGIGRTAAESQEHLFRHCSRWKDQEKTLWKEVGKATGWRAGRCRHVLLTREDDGEEEKMMNCLSIQREGKLWTYIWKREKENPLPTAKAGAQCRVPVPSPPPRHGGKRGWWGQARLVGAGEANGGRKPPATSSSPPAPNTREATGPNP